VRAGCASDGREPAPSQRRAARRERFEDTDRWARGRIVAALVAGEPPPALAPARRARAEAGLLRDGLAVRGADGALRLP
jgi:A/G-specific adenine glycosylase